MSLGRVIYRRFITSLMRAAADYRARPRLKNAVARRQAMGLAAAGRENTISCRGAGRQREADELSFDAFYNATSTGSRILPHRRSRLYEHAMMLGISLLAQTQVSPAASRQAFIARSLHGVDG